MVITKKKRNTRHYKALYLESQVENEKLRRYLKALEAGKGMRTFDFSGILFLLQMIIKMIQSETKEVARMK